MSLAKRFSICIASVLIAISASAQGKGYDVFNPISKYLAQGNADAVSTWFADNIQISVLGNDVDCSRSQARQILKLFFDSYTPRSFEIIHTASRANMKYVLGELSAGGELFRVTIFASCPSDNYRVQLLSIERTE